MDKKTKKGTIYKWIRYYPFLSYKKDSCSIYCSECDIHLKIIKSTVTRHIRQTHETKSEDGNDFYFDLIVFLVTYKIPWSKINDPQFRIFFNKYLCCSCSSRKLPDEVKLRSYHLNLVHNTVIEKICEKMIGKYLWISVDESFIDGFCYANVCIKELAKDTPNKLYLFGRKRLDELDGKCVAELIKTQLKSLWKNSYHENIKNVLLLTTDSKSYMLRAGKMLKRKFPNLLHITCLAHGLYRVIQQIKHEYKNVDMFIKNIKKIFLMTRVIQIFKRKCPLTPLPPKTVDDWGTWLNDVIYYAEHFNDIFKIIYCLKPSDSPSLNDLKILLKSQNLKSDLVSIKAKYEFLYEAMTKLQTPGISLVESFETLDKVRIIVGWTGSSTVKLKVNEILDKIPDYDTIRDYANLIQNGQYENSLIEYYKYAPVTAVNTERSIASYARQWTAMEKRSALKGSNLEKVMTILYYYRENEEDIATDTDFMRYILNEDTD